MPCNQTDNVWYFPRGDAETHRFTGIRAFLLALFLRLLGG